MSFTPCRPGEIGVLAVGHQGLKDAAVERREASGFIGRSRAFASADLKMMRQAALRSLFEGANEKKI